MNVVTGIIMNATQLLCTFTTTDQIDITLKQIVDAYDVAFDTIYILENIDSPNALCCTYNINLDSQVRGHVPDATISLHRKKSTNTLYTINALNLLVADLNNGKPDVKFQVPWEDYKNAILVTAYNKLKRVNTKLSRVAKVSEIKKSV